MYVECTLDMVGRTWWNVLQMAWMTLSRRWTVDGIYMYQKVCRPLGSLLQ